MGDGRVEAELDNIARARIEDAKALSTGSEFQAYRSFQTHDAGDSMRGFELTEKFADLRGYIIQRDPQGQARREALTGHDMLSP